MTEGGAGVAEDLRGHLEPREPAAFGVLVLDVDGRVRVDLVPCSQEFGPVGVVVALAQCDEVSGRRFGPFVGPLVAAQVGVRLVGEERPRPVMWVSRGRCRR